MPERILILGAGPFQLPAIRAARALGFKAVATDRNPEAVGLREADHPETVDLSDVSGCLGLAQHYKIAGVLTVASEIAVPTVAAIAEMLDLPGPGIQGARIATNKAMMRELFHEHSIPCRVARCCTSISDVELAIEDTGLPVVVKPTDNAGSRGVSYVDHGWQLGKAVQHALAHSREKRLLVEEYIPGVEMSVEGFVVNGCFSAIALSDKIRTDPPYLLDTTVLFPSQQPRRIQDAACDVIQRSVDAAGLHTAAIHAELMVGPGGVNVIEFAARGAGFKVFTDMLPWVTGIDVVTVLVHLAVGEPVDLSSPLARGSVLRFPEVPPGRVASIKGVDEARAMHGVKDLELYVRPGDEIPVLSSASDRVGYFVTVGESRREAEEIMERVERVLRIEVTR